MRRTLILVISLVPSIALAKPKTLRIDAGNGRLALTYDPARISEADLRAAAALAPESSPGGVLTMSLETCYNAREETTACGSPGPTPPQPAFFKNAAVTIAKNREVVKAAETRPLPAELEPAKRYLHRRLAFWATLEERKLAFYQTWKTAELARPIDGVDVTKCAAFAAKVDAATSTDDKYKLTRFGWHNCMNDLGHQAFGPYPEAPWKAFLKARRIKATYEADGP